MFTKSLRDKDTISFDRENLHYRRVEIGLRLKELAAEATEEVHLHRHHSVLGDSIPSSDLNGHLAHILAARTYMLVEHP